MNQIVVEIIGTRIERQWCVAITGWRRADPESDFSRPIGKPKRSKIEGKKPFSEIAKEVEEKIQEIEKELTKEG